MMKQFINILSRAEQRGEFKVAPEFWQSFCKRVNIPKENELFKHLNEIIQHRKEVEGEELVW